MPNSNILTEAEYGTGGVPDRVDLRDYQHKEVGFGSAPFDWNVGFDIETKVGKLPVKDQDDVASGKLPHRGRRARLGHAGSGRGAALHGKQDAVRDDPIVVAGNGAVAGHRAPRRRTPLGKQLGADGRYRRADA